MILLVRRAAPAELQEKQASWTEQFRPGARDWATAEIRAALQAGLKGLTRGKCAYCEREGPHEIDHYWDKVRYPQWVFHWDNLLLSCSTCNRRKGNWSHGGALLKPDQDDGEAFFLLQPATGKIEPHPLLEEEESIRRAIETERRLSLNRGELCWARRRNYLAMARKLEEIELAGQLPRRLIADLLDLLDPATPYKLAVRAAMHPELAQVDRRMFHAAD